jgi:hypothetical protein
MFADEIGEAEGQVSDRSVGKTPVSGALCQQEAELADSGAKESRLDATPNCNFPFDKPLRVRARVPTVENGNSGSHIFPVA